MGTADSLKTQLGSALRERADVELCLLFGSEARGTASEGSDVDLAVRAPGTDLLELGASLGRLLGREVDIVPLDEVSVPLLQELIEDAIVVSERRRGAAATWRARSLAMLEIDGPWYARMRDAWLRRVAEKGL